MPSPKPPCSVCYPVSRIANADIVIPPELRILTTADFRVGVGDDWGYQLHLGGNADQGRLLWDPCHELPTDSFFASATVKFQVTRSLVRWSVGTVPFVILPNPQPPDANILGDNEQIREVLFKAELGANPPVASIQWDWIEIHMRETSSSCWEQLISPALPAAIRMPVPLMDEIPAQPPQGNPLVQAAQLRFLNGLHEVRVLAQVSLKANHVVGWEAPLGSNDIKGSIRVLVPAQP
jgi:hypothetical protein